MNKGKHKHMVENLKRAAKELGKKTKLIGVEA
jgi:hypothetical protein